MLPDTELPGCDAAAGDVSSQLHGLRAQLTAVGAGVESLAGELHGELRTILKLLELSYDDDPGDRLRLRALRADPTYEAAFTEPNPLVSVVIPTWDRPEMLVARSIPSVLAQTHENVEVIVIGDASPASTAAAVATVDDPRVSFHNLTVRGPYDEDRALSWLASGTPGFNAGVARARGRWIAALGDDDEFTPDHIATVLRHAREQRLEFVYDRIRQIMPDGGELLLGTFPPQCARTGLQAALYHAGLSFMGLELAHADFRKPNDWGLIHRMMRIGVRMGMVDEVGVNYWPSMRAHDGQDDPDPHAPSSDSRPAVAAAERLAAIGELAETRVRLDRAHAAHLELERHLAFERERAGALDARAADLERRLRDVVTSRSWRVTAPLRRIRARR
jgi:hypothetical protein